MADEYAFEWVNNSPEELTVIAVSSHNLIAPYWAETWIAPKGKGQLFLTLQPVVLGPFDLMIAVTFSNGRTTLQQQLRVKGNILSSDAYQAQLTAQLPSQQPTLTPPSPISSQSSVPGTSVQLTPPGPARVHSPASQWKTKAPQVTMQAQEQLVLAELNAFRKAPKSLIPTIEAYIKDMSGWYLEDITNRHTTYTKAIEAAHSLILTLEKTPMLPSILSDGKAYDVLHEQGNYIQEQGSITFKGSDGRSAQQRHTLADPTTRTAREIYYYEAEETDIQRLVLHLLLDTEDPTRSIRRLLLQPQWTHAAIHQVGAVGQYRNFWALGLLVK